jgi:hypothetical protein
VLSLTLFIIFYNYFESYWMRGFEFLWVVFLITAAEIGRYWRPVPARNAAHRSTRRIAPGHARLSASAQDAHLRIIRTGVTSGANLTFGARA